MPVGPLARILDARLVHAVVLADGVTPVHVRVRGVGVLRVGDDVRVRVLGSFDGVVLTRSSTRIDVRFGFSRRVLVPNLLQAPSAPRLRVRAPTATPDLFIPRPTFDVAVGLPDVQPEETA